MTQVETGIGFQHIGWNVTGGIGQLILNRPPSNDMTGPFFEEVNNLVDCLSNESELRGIIIRGAGRHFSSGAALDELLARISENPCTTAGDEEENHFLIRNYRAMLWFEEAPMPVVAAIRGVCLGSAFELALLCHFRICSEDAVFGLPETTFNLLPGLGGIRKIVELSGKANAIELVLRGKTFSATEALELGLVDVIVPKKEMARRALDLVSTISDGYRKEKRPLYLKRYFTKDVAVEDQAV
jgi:enoyl-CoA hydratase